MNSTKNKFIYFESLIIIAFWALLFASPLLFGRFESKIDWNHITNVWINYLPLLGLFLINRFILLPRLFFNGKKYFYFLSIVVLIVLFTTAIFLNERPQAKSNRPQQVENIELLPPSSESLRKPPHLAQALESRPRPIPTFANFIILAVLLVGFDAGLKTSMQWAKLEPLALKQIASYIDKTPFLTLIAQFESALQAISFVQENKIDLMFVDINMPDLNGMDFVKSLNNPPKVIFTTAYSEYALEGFKVDAVDYLLKPIGYLEFLKASEKANERIKPKGSIKEEIQSDDSFLFIKSEYKILRINLTDIKYIEGMREYVRIHLMHEKPIMTLMSMKKMEEFLPQSAFMRVHRSFIVNLNKITTVERNRIIFDEKVYIPVSEQHKEKFQKYLDENFLV